MINAPIEVPIHLRHLSQPMQQPDQQGAGQMGTAGGQKIKFVNPNTGNYKRNLEYSAELHKRGVACYKRNELIKPGAKKGPPVIVCGSGSSLKDPQVLTQMREHVANGALVFACKQAIKFLHDQGIKIDYGVTMDPGAHIARAEKIYKAPGMTHLVASSSDILLFDYFMTDLPYHEWIETLSEEDQKRILEGDYDAWKAGTFVLSDAGEHPADIKIFHSATGYEREVEMYNTRFKTPDCMGGGYNVVNRAVSAAIFMGASKVILAGCDCGWRMDDKFYVDGSENRPGVDMSDHGMVEMTDTHGKRLETPPEGAREWMTRPDMLASGVALAKLIKRTPDLFEVLGDTLPLKLVSKSDDFLKQCASFK